MWFKSHLDECATLSNLGIYDFEPGHNITETVKHICMKDEGALTHRTITRWFMKFCTGYKKLDDRAISDKPKTLDFEAMLQAIEANQTNISWRLWSEFGTSQSSVVNHLSKSIWSC